VVLDPFASLPVPSVSGSVTAVNVSGNSSQTINPGIYSSISVSGNGNLTMNGGIYVIAGGGFTITANAIVNGSGVLIYNAGSSYPRSGGTFASVNFSGNGNISLTPMTSGAYAGIILFQSRDNTQALALSGNAISGTHGTIYAANAEVALSGNAQLAGVLVAGSLNMSGNAIANDLTSDGQTVYTPAQIRDAYGINAISLDGTGQTIAIVDAYDNPDIFTAVDAFDTQFGLTDGGPSLQELYGPAATFLTVLNQQGQAGPLPMTDPTGPGTANWEMESELDVEWVHSIAPGARIVLVEANSQSLADLMASVGTAGSQPGVSVVSMSWGFPEGQTVLAQDEALYDTYLSVPGVTFVASSGDYGTADLEYPAISPKVVAVGGTSLNLNSDNSYNSETGWGYDSAAMGGTFIGSGGGVSLYEPEPAYQEAVQNTGSRTSPDVSLVADPATGAWIADPYNLGSDQPWQVVGGTSLSAPSWAGLILLANQARVDAGQPTLNSSSATETQQALYNLPMADFNDVTTGNNGFAAGSGYDLVTGLGTPVANLLVPDLADYSGTISSERTITVTGNLQQGSWAPDGGGDAAMTGFNVFSALVASPSLGTAREPTVPAGLSATAVLAGPLTQQVSLPSTSALALAPVVPTSTSATRLFANASSTHDTDSHISFLFEAIPLTEGLDDSGMSQLPVPGLVGNGTGPMAGTLSPVTRPVVNAFLDTAGTNSVTLVHEASSDSQAKAWQEDLATWEDEPAGWMVGG
jgi:hypothetical protein